MFRFKTLLAGLALSIALPGLASAATVTVRDNAATNGSSAFAAGLSERFRVRHNGDNRIVRGGVFSLQFGSDADGWTDFLTFCLQLDEFLSLPRDHERIGSGYFMDADDRNAMGIIWNKFSAGLIGLDNGVNAAAVQAVIWEITTDGAANFDLLDGDFEFRLGGTGSLTNTTNDVYNAAIALWNLIDGGGMAPIAFDVFRAENSQDLITNVVPVPGAAVLLISGLFGLGFASRKKKAAIA